MSSTVLADTFYAGSGEVDKLYLGATEVWSAESPAPEFSVSEVLLHGGGTHNSVNYSPNGAYIAAFADVGGTRRRGDDKWTYLPTTGNNADRQVAGGVILNDGTVFSLVGNGMTGGRLLEYSPTGSISVRVSGLAVKGNDFSTGDTGARPRPVGWMVAYDATNDIVYMCTEDGVFRYNRGTSTNDGRIALTGVSCRGFAHTNDGHVNGAGSLVVATRTLGLVRLIDALGTAVAVRSSSPAWSRFDDAAVINGEKLLCAAHEQGVYRYDATGCVTLNGSQDIDGPSASVTTKSQFTIAVEADLDWANDVCDLVGNWHSSTVSSSQHRLTLDGSGILRYRIRNTSDTIANLTATAAVTVTGRAWVRVRRASAGNDCFFEESSDGVTWTQVGNAVSSSADVQDYNVQWSIGGTLNGTGRMPAGSKVYRAYVTHSGGSTPVVSFDATGLVSGDTTYTDVAAGAWTLNGTVTAGAVNVTPSTSSGTGANGGTTRFVTAACINVSGTVLGAVGVVNPDSAAEWIYRTTNVETVTTTWNNGTPSLATKNAGSTQFEPTNRYLGASGGSGSNLTGVYGLCFDPSDSTGNTLLATATLSVYRSTNFAGTAGSITWGTYNDDLSMMSLPDVHVDSAGNVLWAASDHNAFVISGANLLTNEPARVAFSGLGDAWSVFSVGSGADKVTVLCPTQQGSAAGDVYNSNNNVAYHRGSGLPSGWTTTGYNADLNAISPLTSGQRPRAAGVFGWDNGGGTYTFVVYAEGVGYVRSTLTLSGNSWSTWTKASTGPTAVTSGGNQESQIVGKSDGSVLFGIELNDGDIWRSTDGGANWTNIATSIGGSQTIRKGRIAYNATQDWLAVSDADGLHRISAATTSPAVTTISGVADAGPVAIDSAGRLYCHTHESGAIRLLRFGSFSTATAHTDAANIAAGSPYVTRIGQLATNMTIGVVNGVERGFTVYQGSGTVTWAIPS